MARVLLTGATGFVGRAVMAELVVQGCEVACVVRAGTAGRLPAESASIAESDDLFAECPDWWAERLSGVDLALHLAWYAEPGKYLVSDKNLDCLSGTLAMAKGAAQAGVPRFVGVGTCFEYDLIGGDLTADTQLNPQTPYAAAKAAAYLTLRSYFAEKSISFLWARLFYLYGEGEDPRRLVPYLHQQMQRGEPAELSGGGQVRDFIDVKDAARLMVSEALGTRQGATNISTGKGITVRSLAESIADGYGRRDLLRFGARPDNLTDPARVVGVRPEEGE